MSTETTHDPLVPVDDERYLAALLVTLSRSTHRDEALERVAPDDFANPHIGAAWAASRSLLADSQRITTRSVLGRLDHGTVAVERLLTELGGVVPHPAEFGRAVAEVTRCARLRRVVRAADAIRQRAMTAEDPEQALSWASEELGKLEAQSSATTPEVRLWPELLDEFTAAMDPNRDRNEHWTIPTPWEDINEVTAGGLHPGRMYVIGARPGEGKSIAAHRIAVHAASLGHSALVYSLEMGSLEVTGRMVAGATEVEMAEISRRELSAHSRRRVTEFTATARAWPLAVVDKAGVGIDYIRAVCRAHQRRHGLRVVAVDYLQLVAADRHKPREQAVAEVSRQLKHLSRELDVAVIVPAQLNRGPANRGGGPRLSDLRESGGIEADADVVILLEREQVPSEEATAAGFTDPPKHTGMVNIEIAKNRHGPVTGMKLVWRGHYASIG